MKIWRGKQIRSRCEAMADTRSRAHQGVASIHLQMFRFWWCLKIWSGKRDWYLADTRSRAHQGVASIHLQMF